MILRVVEVLLEVYKAKVVVLVVAVAGMLSPLEDMVSAVLYPLNLRQRFLILLSPVSSPLGIDLHMCYLIRC